MTEFQKFKLKLYRHPGLKPAIFFTIIGFIVSLEHNLTKALLCAAVMSIFWIPVLITSWTDRNNSN